jgi:hypothetical protein
MENACTWVGCSVTKQTQPQLDAGRAWAHLCSAHLRQYVAEMQVLRSKGGLSVSQQHYRELTLRACGGEEAWRRYLFGPFGKGREKPKVIAGQDEPAA